MNKLIVSAVLAIVLFTSGIVRAQALEVITSEAKLVQGANNFVTIGDSVYLRNGSSNISYTVVGLIRVKTEAANVEVLASDSQRTPVEVELIAPEYYRIQKSGRFWVDVTAIDFDKNIYGRQQKILEVGAAPPTPDPEPDPGPSPEPEPDPTPVPDAPIDAPGMHILVVFETAPTDAEQMTPAQANMLNSVTTREYLTSIAPGNWRLLDKDTYYSDSENIWGKAIKRPRTEIPWLIISNGKTGYEGPLPKTFDELKALITPLVETKRK